MSTEKQDNNLFCFGYGYSCDYLSRALQMRHWNITGTTRDPEKRALMKTQDIKAHIFDYDSPLDDGLRYLQGTTHLLISTPPDDRGDPSFILHGEDVREIPSIRWIGYLSSTAVYGDRTGGWVDEESETRPNTKRGSRRLYAEKQWLSLYEEAGLPVHIFRLAGIYGPGRSALDSVRAGNSRRINKPGHAFSRIHVDDIVQVLMASMAKPNPGAVYNLADDLSSHINYLIKLACEMLGLPVPPLLPYEEADMAPITRSFYADNKRVKNDRIKNELGVKLKYPTYVEGLQACLDAEQTGNISTLAVSAVEGA